MAEARTTETNAGSAGSAGSAGGSHAADEHGASRLAVLLEFAELDLELRQTDYQIEHLPEREALAQAESQAAQLRRELAAVGAESAELSRKQRREEDEVARIEAKRAANRQRLDDPGLTSPKEAAALTAEAEALARRQSDIEDGILELMEAAVPLEERHARTQADADSVAARVAELHAAISSAEADADARRAELHSTAERLRAQAAPDLVDLYDRRRGLMRGAAAVGRLVGTRCQACYLDLAAVDRERIARIDPDEPVDCPECGAILVR